MKDNYGSRYRFYEIMQAHKNGEDLSQFTPKNKPEEELIAQLQGGAGSSGGSGMPDIVLNNPNLSDIYYGMTGNNTMVINTSKLAEYLKNIDYEGINSTIPNGSDTRSVLWKYDLLTFYNVDTKSTTTISFGLVGYGYGALLVNDTIEKTYNEYSQLLGNTLEYVLTCYGGLSSGSGIIANGIDVSNYISPNSILIGIGENNPDLNDEMFVPFAWAVK